MPRWLTETTLSRLSLAAGAPVFGLPVTDSTMHRAREHAEAGAVHGTTVFAEAQTAGRGRLNRVWASPPGHVYASTLWRLDRAVAAVSCATLGAGVAIAEAIEAATGLEVELKWPNDAKLHGKKCAGILASLASMTSEYATVIIGVGIDVAPLGWEHAGLDATSLSDASQRRIDVVEVAEGLVAALARHGSRLNTGDFDRDGWRRRCRLFGRVVRVTPPGAPPWSGMALDLAESGELLVDRRGTVERVIAGDVVLVDSAPS